MNQLLDPAHPIQFWATITTLGVLGVRLGIPAVGAALRSTYSSFESLLDLTWKSIAPKSYERVLMAQAFDKALPAWVSYKPKKNHVWQHTQGNILTVISTPCPGDGPRYTITNAQHVSINTPGGNHLHSSNMSAFRDMLSNGWTRKV